MMKLISYISISLIILLTIGMYNINSQSLTDQQILDMINEGSHLNLNKQLLHKEKVKNGIVAFYGYFDNPNTLGARYIKRNLFGWEATFDRGGGGFGSSVKKLDSILLEKYDRTSPFPLIMGLVNDTRIARVEVEFDFRGTTKIIQATSKKSQDKHFWFVFVKEPRIKTEYRIKGYSESGELIDSVLEESSK